MTRGFALFCFVLLCFALLWGCVVIHEGEEEGRKKEEGRKREGKERRRAMHPSIHPSHPYTRAAACV